MTLKYFVFFCPTTSQKNPLNASVMTFRCTELIRKEFSLRNPNSHLVSFFFAPKTWNPRNWRQLSHFMEPVNCRNIFKSSRALTENLDNFTIFISRSVRGGEKSIKNGGKAKGNLIFAFPWCLEQFDTEILNFLQFIWLKLWVGVHWRCDARFRENRIIDF